MIDKTKPNEFQSSFVRETVTVIDDNGRFVCDPRIGSLRQRFAKRRRVSLSVNRVQVLSLKLKKARPVLKCITPSTSPVHVCHSFLPQPAIGNVFQVADWLTA